MVVFKDEFKSRIGIELQARAVLLPASRSQRAAFTLIELLVAMTITLLLMAALGKAFAVIGQSMKEGRSQVTLSAKLRSLSYRVRSDLRGRTVEARPNVPGSQSGDGYITYYEGPLSEHTWGIFGADAVRFDDDVAVSSQSTTPNYLELSNSPTYRRLGRYGDFDDYLAFTAKAPGDSWFTGKVPRYLIDDSVNTGSPIDEQARMQPVVIRSKYAEIVFWAEPEYQVNPSTGGLVLGAGGMPLYRDDNNDYVPDSVTVHQRILLIRPDLNVRGTIPTTAAGASFNDDFLRPIDGSTTAPGSVPPALAGIYPIGAVYNPSYVDSRSITDPSFHLNSNWLLGMTPLHHFFDLSLRRVVHPITGEPTNYVAANSLADLVEPHNRFAHVRYPGRFFGYGAGSTDYATSMPLLAMGWQPAILTWNSPDARGSGAAPAWFPSGYPNLTAQNAALRSPLFNGWLLPHFTLGDPNPVPSATGNIDRWRRGYLGTAYEDPRWDRTGEDVLAANVLAFDLKGFDPSAPVFLTAGMDGAPGRAGLDDDGSGGDPDTSQVSTNSNGVNQVHTELGAVGSDDVIVRIGELGIFPLLRQNILDPRDADDYAATPGLLAGRHNQMIATTGDFVDLFYPFVAGGPLLDTVREAGPFPATPTRSAPSTLSAAQRSKISSLFQSELSGYPIVVDELSPLKSSGKLVHNGTTGAYRFFQPCFDTWTSGYESDGFDQTQSSSGAVSGEEGTVWVLNDANASAVGRNARLPTPAAAPALFSVDTGKHDPTAPECLPPLLTELRAISLSIRLVDPVSQEMSEITVLENLID